MDTLTGFQRDLLYVIANLDDPTGQTVTSELQEYCESNVDSGRLYPNREALVNKGLVEKGQLNGRTNSYTLIEAGRQALRDRREWENQYVDL